jgi:hypothetical protein
MKKLIKVLATGAILTGLLSACGNAEEKVMPKDATKVEAVTTTNTKTETVQKKQSNGILTYGETFKGNTYNIMVNSAQFYNPNPDFDKIESPNSRYLLVNVNVKNATDSAVDLIGMNFTLKDEKTGKTYERQGNPQVTGSSVTPWGDIFDITLQKGDSLTGAVPFVIPNGNDTGEYTLYIDNLNSEEAQVDSAQWKLNNVTKSNF